MKMTPCLYLLMKNDSEHDRILALRHETEHHNHPRTEISVWLKATESFSIGATIDLAPHTVLATASKEAGSLNVVMKMWIFDQEFWK